VHRILPAVISLGLSIGFLASAVPAEAVTRTPYNTNILKNGNFEAGVASATGYESVAIPGWSSTNVNATVVKYGTAGGFPTAAEGLRISGAKQFFTNGPHVSGFACAVTYQQKAIKGRNAIIDAGKLKMKVSAQVATYGNQSDTAVIIVSLVNSNGDEVGTLLPPEKSLTNGVFQKVGATGTVPPQTRKVQITLFAAHTVGYCDAYFDNISIKIFPA